MATAIDNSGIKDFCGNCGCPGFLPGVSAAFNPAAKTLIARDTSAYGAGDGLKSVNVVVTTRADKKSKYAQITVTGAPGEQTVNLAGMDVSEGVNVRATVVTNARCVADLGSYGLGMAASTQSVQLGNIDNEGDIDG
jgi:hypothetical protein